MNKIFLIFSREYLSRVKKKSFLMLTILVPIIIMAFYALIIYISLDGSNEHNEQHKIALIDPGNLLKNKINNTDSAYVLSFVKNETEQDFLKKYKTQGFESFIYIPDPSNLLHPELVSQVPLPKIKLILHSEKTMSMPAVTAIEHAINNTIRNNELLEKGINPKEFEELNNRVTLENRIETKEGSKKNYASVAYGVSFVCGIMIYMMMLIYGTQVMKGVTEEKTNRIAEVLVSSVKPFQMMMGKILGIGAVGLTQFAIWMVLMFLLQFSIPLIFSDILQQANHMTAAQQENTGVMMQAMQGLTSLPIAKILGSFVFYFLGGYLLYASIFAAIGSAVSDDQSETQQLVPPVMMPIILGFVIMTKAVDDPNSSLAVFGSIFPLTSPIVMMGRITYDIPVWQIIVSMATLTVSFLFFTWVGAKIYRTGILMYGKKAGWKELIKWAFAKS